ncbi:hypothetical protein [Pedobacter heparinus]|uniref:Uncharacterized protein n=1 Tax=Pedobacter heparinus (strain ATCC 13125 / DSM 2366 / CIP 104194 / JCM 7457 / NBRC 12017 / NCIMB 9290 / NRRL B-14731 / HIM 762-3) TaxID=485917 RepID=C6XWS5_PEDHD|nr:hypothetical protein [Pedobacter heparinus]ACU04219.1 hypothetical protein Phep_2014 [Pedobacter heparinus DSM 2366]
MNEEEIIKGSIFHLMNFMIMELLRHGFLLAMRDELKDLKGLVRVEDEYWLAEPSEYVCITDEIELLRQVKDPLVKLIMSSVDKISRYKDTYLMVNNLDSMEIICNDEFNEAAGSIYYANTYEMDCDGSYNSIYVNVLSYYWCMELILFYGVTQFMLNKEEVYEEVDKNYEHYHTTKGFETLTDNKNALLLLDLMAELNKDGYYIGECDLKTTKKNEDGKI